MMSLVGYRTAVSKTGTPTLAVAKSEFASSAKQDVPSGLRPVVRNAIQALRAMPPEARQRRLASGRYDDFSPEEQQLLISATQRP
jgi:hypothetical protein